MRYINTRNDSNGTSTSGIGSTRTSIRSGTIINICMNIMLTILTPSINTGIISTHSSTSIDEIAAVIIEPIMTSALMLIPLLKPALIPTPVLTTEKIPTPAFGTGINASTDFV